MTRSMHLPLLLALGVAACTTSTEADVAMLGASLGNLSFAAGPQLPPKQFPQPVQLCPTKPDLAVTAVTATNSASGWMYLCTSVKNQGGVAWSSNASQIVITSGTGSQNSVNLGGLASLATGATIQKCGWIKVAGLVRLGHDEPARPDRCNASIQVTSRFTFDPDIALDGNTANDDCKTTNNTRTATINYAYSGSCLI